MTTLKIRELKAKRTKLGADAKAIMEEATSAGRAMNGEENTRFDKLMDERDQIDATIERAEKLLEDERDKVDDLPDDKRGKGGDETAEAKAFRAYLLNGRAQLTEQQARALNMGSDPEGGFLMAPQQFVQELLQAVDDMVAIRRLATVQQITTAESLGVPTLDTDLNDADWTSEVSTGSQDDSLRFGKRELRPNPVAKRVKVSRTLLRRAAISPENIVRQRLEYKFGVTQEKAFMTGDGNKKPLGLFTASSDGIPASRDVATGSATGFTSDGLIDAKYSLKSQYWAKARWLFHRDAIRIVRKIKDDNGQYVWQPGLAADRPDTVLDSPYEVNEFVPNTFTNGNYVGMFGDFSFYWIVDALAMDIQRLVELYAETNQVGFIGRMESDGMPVMAEAFVRLKAATS
ncbi:phage major capsid protein [Streptomyces sp. SID13726]|uniref:phage major capsid protein n=1 Tax=Streptomyces sp. SID13726 TaxID=2706058 RepID=UPI0013BE5094|nr:phage major capsid protein [Streptomyces sp. SID13726]NEB00618.1 phage major capsid protein [Streptomyces sp. SID13726]